MPFMYDGTVVPPGVTGWDPEKYESAVRFWMTEIRKRDVGRIMLDTIPKWVTIQAYLPKAGSTDTRNAGSRAVNPADARPEGMPRMSAKEGVLLDGARGTGLGSDTTVSFTPRTWIGGTGPGEAPDEVLFHELMHSFRQTTGTFRAVAARHDMDTEEEVVAIALTNMYSSERNRPARKNHRTDAKGSFIELPREDHAAWVQRHAPYLKSFFRQNKALCQRLLQQPSVSFNPFPFN